MADAVLEVSRAMERLFTDEELRTLATHPGDLAFDAIERGDITKARQICVDSKDMHQVLHYNYSEWHAHNFAHIVRAHGLKAALNALPHGISPWFRAISDRFRDGATREAVGYILQIWRMYCKDFGRVEEDKATISVRLADYGKMYYVDQSGLPVQTYYHEISLAAFAPQDSREPQVPFSACAILCSEKLMTGWLGYPAFVIDFHPDGSPDRLVIYKDPGSIPQRYFDRIGSQRDNRRIAGAVEVAGGRLFTDAELVELGRQHMQRAASAIDAGDLLAAKGWAKLSKGEWFPAHHAHRDWITGMLGYVYREYGVDQLYETVAKGYEEPFVAPMMQAVAELPVRQQVEGLSMAFHQHAMKFHLEEFTDRIAIVTEPCGSGGRLLQEGAYDPTGPLRFPVIAERHKGTFFLEDFPVYCMHCPSTNRFLLGQGGPHSLIVDGDMMKKDGNCNFYIFKEHAAVPNRFYERAALSRGDCGSCKR